MASNPNFHQPRLVHRGYLADSEDIFCLHKITLARTANEKPLVLRLPCRPVEVDLWVAVHAARARSFDRAYSRLNNASGSSLIQAVYELDNARERLHVAGTYVTGPRLRSSSAPPGFH